MIYLYCQVFSCASIYLDNHAFCSKLNNIKFHCFSLNVIMPILFIFKLHSIKTLSKKIEIQKYSK